MKSQDSIHGWIKSSAAIVQAFALFGGVYFGISELRTREAERIDRILNHTLQVTIRLSDPAVQAAIEFIESNTIPEDERLDVTKFGEKTLAWRLIARSGLFCLLAGQCDQEHMRYAFCSHAASYANRLRDLKGKITEEELIVYYKNDWDEPLMYRTFCPREFSFVPST
jgi:hypothetical protein